MSKPETKTIGIHVSDVSAQNAAVVKDIPSDATVGELLNELLAQMTLPKNDSTGRPITYLARREREGRHLHSSEVIGEVLEDDDRVALLPEIDAGGTLGGKTTLKN